MKAGRMAGSPGASSGSASSSAPLGATNSAVNGQGGLNTDQTPAFLQVLLLAHRRIRALTKGLNAQGGTSAYY
jgi:hypothetical protein